MADPPEFIFTTCQLGAESALKREMARLWPELRFAYSRPGFLTFKLPPEHPLAEKLELRSVFARAAAYSLGKVSSATLDERARGAWEAVGELPIRTIHVWQRDVAVPGDRQFAPGVSPEAKEAERAIYAQAPRDLWRRREPGRQYREASRGQLVFDCVLVEPQEWWIGYHWAGADPSRFPGGVIPVTMPEEAVSRAYLKMEEALRWSRLPIQPGERCVELGSSPGGASQALLAHGLQVTGVDPAEMAPEVLAHPNFRHLRARGVDLKRRVYRPFRWLTADMNVAPRYTLDTVEAIVTRPDVHIRGLLLTLKLPDWKLADEIPAHLDRVRAWGYREVRARQLAHNRQEICLAALRSRSLRRRK
jgi:23S rRNA (cytidine2498-2'-O)-methyltransferase